MRKQRTCFYSWWGFLFLSLLLPFLAPAQSHAATFTVNNTTDALVANAVVNGICETAVGNGVCTLRAAIQLANVPGAGPTTINLPAGTYILTRIGPGEDAALTGDLDITSLSPITIIGAGAATTIIDGNNSDRIFDILGATSSLSISGVTIRNGNSAAIVGGGIRMAGAGRTLNLTDVVVTANKTNANIGGTAIDIGGGGATVTMINVAVTNNIPVPPGGGDIIGVGANSTFTMTNGTISGNRDSSVSTRGAVTLTNVTISGNIAPNAAGIDVKAGTVTLLNCTITDNIATAAGGIGGIRNAGAVTVKNTIIANNTTLNCDVALTSQGNNLTNVAGCGLSVGAGDIINSAPLLETLANNGGSLQTVALRPGSPAIDAGAAVGCPATDARGITRPFAGLPPAAAACDIGAFEFRPAQITVTLPPPFDFGNVLVNSTAAHIITLGNAGDGPLDIGTIAPPAAPFGFAADGCSTKRLTQIPLPPTTCAMTIGFTPTAVLSSSDSFTIPSNDPVTPAFSFALSGTGSPTAVPGISVADSIAPANDGSMPFGGVAVDGSADATVTITNTGTSDLVLGTIASADALAAPFSILNDTCSGKTLAPTAACTLTVRFSPTASGPASDTFDIPSTGLPTVTMSVSGTGGVSTTGNNPPTKPVLVSPANSQTGVSTSMTFVWKKSVDPDGDAITYHFENCTDTNFTTGCTNADVLAAASSRILYAGLGSFGAGIILIGFVAGSGLKRSKKTMIVITLLLLAGGLFMSCTRTKTETVTLTPQGIAADEAGHVVTGLAPNTIYYWKVVADDGKGVTSSSDVWSYTTGQ